MMQRSWDFNGIFIEFMGFAKVPILAVRTASASVDSSTCRMASTAASQPDRCPAHNCSGPAAAWISSLIALAIALPIMHLSLPYANRSYSWALV